jgi:OOP family OmpA-OmpF porin
MFTHKRHRRSLAFAAAGAALVALAGCSDLFGGDDTSTSQGTPFTQALAKDYTDLANQTASVPAPDSDEGFFDNPFGLFGSDNPADAVVKAYNDKATAAGQGQEPAPEAAPAMPNAQAIHDQVTQAIAAGKDRFPEQAARAQADYDCWVLDSSVTMLAAAAQACRTALDGSMLALENAVRPAPPPMPVAPPAPPPPPPPPPPSNYTVYFDFDSWTLKAEELTVITDAINSARSGGQSHITVVGHTDTMGSAAYNQRLSVRRANVVVEAMVDMGARREAIQASGVGKTDLAVQTPDQTREAKNRRTVITLLP